MKVALISVYGSRCGIATYNESLVLELKKLCEVKVFAEKTGATSTSDVIYCWEREKWPQIEMMKEVRKYAPDIILFSHEYGFYPKGSYQFTCLVSYFKWIGYSVFSIFHSVYPHKDKSVQESCVPNIIVHSEGAKNCLIGKGIKPENINVVTHGIDYLSENKELLKPLWNTWGTKTIFSCGYAFKYKGTLNFLDIFKRIVNKYPNAHYIAQLSISEKCKNENEKFYEEVMRRVEELDLLHHTTINKGFASMEVLLSHIRTCSVVIYPYIKDNENGVYAATGAARIPLSTETPVITSDAHLFDDLKDLVLVGKDDEEIYQHICNIFDGNFNLKESNKRRIKFIEETSWKREAERLFILFKDRLP
jgi:hypothetical protein